MDDLSLRVYLENAADADRGGWLELPVAPERLDAFMRGVVGVDDGGGYAVVDHEPGWFGDVLGSDLESFSVSSLNLAARCVAHARDLAVADSVDGDVFLDMLATAAESEDVRFPSGIAALAARAGDVAEFWTEYSLPDSWRAGNSSPDELYGAHVAYALLGDDAYSSLSLFGVDVLSALEDTLRRIRSARAGMGDFDEVAREVMGVEQFRPEMYDDDYGSVPLDLGYALPALLASFEPRPAAASAPDGADPTLLADDSAASSRLV